METCPVDLAVAQLGLGLALELRVGSLTLMTAVKPSRTSSPVKLRVLSLSDCCLAGVLVERRG